MVPSEGLPRKRIIRRRDVFNLVREKGFRRTNRCFLLNVLNRPAEILRDPTREDIVAFITPKKLGPANVRNRIRRRMREVFRRSPYYLKGEHKHFLVWVARGPVSELTFADFSKGMLELLAKTFPK